MALFSTASQAANQVVIPTAVAPTVRLDNEALVIEASKALVAPVVALKGLARPMHPWQDAAIVYANDSFLRWGGCLVGDDMGLGKTAVALALVVQHRDPSAGPAIVVAPPANLGGYQREIRDAFPNLVMFVAKGRKTTRVPAGTDIVWMSDDALTMRAWLCNGHTEVNGVKVPVPSPLLKGAAMYIRDEIHRDKGQAAKPTMRARMSLLASDVMRMAGRYVVGMTGTLLQNRPVEGFIPLQIVGGPALVKAMVPGSNTMGAYLVRFCKGDVRVVRGTSHPVWNGANHTHELHNRLRATCYVRREKSDIDPTALPHFGWSIVPFALGGSVLKQYQRAEDDLIALIREEKGAEAAFRAARAETIVRMQRLWQEAGKAKADAAIDYVSDLVDEGDQVVVFYQHQDVFTALLEGFTAAGITVGWINGQTSNRRKMEDEFQDGKTQVMLAQLQAAGQALTLTAARHAVWVQTPWAAGMLAQQRDRIRRCDDISAARAKAGITVQFHVIQAAKENGDDTWDMAMWSVVENKAKVIDAVNAGREVTLPDESIMEEVLRTWFASK